MNATGFVLSITFTLVKPLPRQALSARHGLILNEPHPRFGVVECAQRAAFAFSIHPPYWFKSLIWARRRTRGSYQQNLFANLCITIRQNLQALDTSAVFTVTSKLGRPSGTHINRAPRPPRGHVWLSARPARRELLRAIDAANGPSCARRDAPSSPSPTDAGRPAC